VQRNLSINPLSAPNVAMHDMKTRSCFVQRRNLRWVML